MIFTLSFQPLAFSSLDAENFLCVSVDQRFSFSHLYAAVVEIGYHANV